MLRDKFPAILLPFKQSLVMRVYTQGKVNIIQCVFVTAVDQCVIRELFQFLQRMIKLFATAVEYAAASAAE